jgi:hypothetical protein
MCPRVTANGYQAGKVPGYPGVNAWMAIKQRDEGAADPVYTQKLASFGLGV